MKNITLEINGQKVTGPEGATVLDIARANDIDIPTLCNDEKLEPFGSCFLCIVEVEGARRLMPACATTASDGMVVKTETGPIKDNRRMCLELLLSDHVGDCLGPCTVECPNSLDPQGYIAHAAAGRYDEAIKLIKSVLPLPAAIGRVCPRPCEDKCRRNVIGDPVAIDAIKRYIADWDLFGEDAPWTPAVSEPTGKKVAIIGAGPAGLTAAYFLTLQGHQAVIFDMMPKPGGMFRYGIPEYRLPYEIIDKEVETITKLGVEIQYGKKLGRDFGLSDLKKDYDAVLVAVGAWKSSAMRCEGEDLPGVWGGIDFLRVVTEGDDPEVGDHVVVVGGGNTAVDAARTAWRLGSKVTILYRRTRHEMPAHPDEVEAALHEEIDIQFLAAPTKVEANGDRLAMTCIRMELGEPDASGRRRPVPIDGSDFTVDASTVIAAIGQKVDLSWMGDECKLDATRWGSILADEPTGTTSVEGIFAAGDCASGADIAIKAIGGARHAAAAIDRFLMGQPVEVAATKLYDHTRGANEQIAEETYRDVERTERERLPEISLEQRRGSNDEVELTYTEEQMLREASRCLECGCQDIDECDLRTYATRYGLESNNRFAGTVKEFELDDNHPYLSRDPGKCIKCARCIRTCLEVQGIGAWGFVDRGFSATVQPTFGRPLQDTDCESCGQCVSTCPTGALTERVPGEKPGPFVLERVESTCSECGVGCSIELAGTGAHLLKVLPRPACEGSNGGNLCQKGRFERVFEEADRVRVTEPLVRKDGRLVKAAWDEALTRAAEVLGQGGGEGTAVFVSPRATNEEAYLAGRVGRTCLKTNNIGSLAVPDGTTFRRTSFAAGEVAPYVTVAQADLVIFVDPRILEHNTVIGNHVLSAVGSGAGLVVIGEGESKLDWTDALKVECSPTETAAVLQGITASLADDGAEVPSVLADERDVRVAMVGDAKRLAIVANRSLCTSESLEAVDGLCSALEKRGAEAAAVLLHSDANALGLCLAGVDPHHGPGLEVLANQKGQYPAELLSKGQLKGALLVGDDPLGNEELSEDLKRGVRALPSVVVIDSHMSATAQEAAVVLPGAARHETEGTYTNSEGRVQRTRALTPPAGGRSTTEVLVGLGVALGGEDTLSALGSPQAVYEELAGLVASYDEARW